MAWSFDVAPILGRVKTRGLDRTALLPALGQAASITMRHIVEHWPIDTGESIAGFRTKRSGVTWLVTNGVEYTEHVHNGIVDTLAAEGLRSAQAQVQKTIDIVAGVTTAPRGSARDRIRAKLRARREKSGVLRSKVSTATVAPTARVGAARLEANAMRDALRIVGPMLSNGNIPRSVVTDVRRGMLVRAARTLRDKGLTRAASQLESISRRGRRI